MKLTRDYGISRCEECNEIYTKTGRGSKYCDVCKKVVTKRKHLLRLKNNKERMYFLQKRWLEKHPDKHRITCKKYYYKLKDTEKKKRKKIYYKPYKKK